MRSTFTLDDDVVRLVKAYASSRSLTMSEALSELVRCGLSTRAKTRIVNGLAVFDVPADSEAVTSDQVKLLETEGQ